MKNNEYIAGIAVRTPKDFTHPSVYAEMDRQALHDRKIKKFYLVSRFVGWVAFVLGFLLAIRWLSK
jgi:hypothetical protein